MRSRVRGVRSSLRGGKSTFAVASVALLVALTACETFPNGNGPNSGVIRSNIIDTVNSPLDVRPPTDCDDLVREMRSYAHAELVAPMSTTTTTSAPSGASTTIPIVGWSGWATGSRENQPIRTAETGPDRFPGASELDQPRNVVLDGRRLFVLRWGVLRSFDVSSPVPRELGAIDLGGIFGRDRWEATLLVRDQTVFVFDPNRARIVAVALDKVRAPERVTADLRIDGGSSLVGVDGDTAHLVVSNTASAYVEADQAPRDPAIRGSLVTTDRHEDWLSTFTLMRGSNVESGLTVPCSAIDRSSQGVPWQTLVLGVELTSTLSEPSGRAFAGGFGSVLEVVDRSFAVRSEQQRPLAVTRAERSLLSAHERESRTRTFSLDGPGAATLTNVATNEARPPGKSWPDEIAIGQNRTLLVETGHEPDVNSVHVSIAEIAADGTERLIAHRRFQNEQGWIGRARWDASARRAFIPIHSWSANPEVLSVDVTDPGLAWRVIADVSGDDCGWASFITASDGDTVWLVDDAVRAFRRDDLTELGRSDMPRPNVINNWLPICD